MAQLGKLSGLLGQEGLGEKAQILAISPDTPDQSRKMQALVKQEYEVRIDFPLLSDPRHQVIDRYGLRNPEGEGWPHPAVFILDHSGTVVWKFLETNHRIRAPEEEIVRVLRRMQ